MSDITEHNKKKLGIFNGALSIIGEFGDLESLEEKNDIRLAYCDQFYTDSLAALMDAHHWSFATKSVKLTPIKKEDLVEKNDILWSFFYILPPDFLRLVDVLTRRTTFGVHRSVLSEIRYGKAVISEDTVTAQLLCTNANEIILDYISKSDEAHMRSPLFNNALMWHLGSMLAGPIIKGQEGAMQTQRCQQMSMMYLQQAIAVDPVRHTQSKNVMNHLPQFVQARQESKEE